MNWSKLWQTVKPFLKYLAVTVLTAILTWLSKPAPEAPPPGPPWMQNFGWVEDAEAVAAVAETLRFKVFSDTPAGKSDDPLPQRVYLWDAYKKLFGSNPPSKDQGQVGSCVSFGTNTAIRRTMAVDIALKGRAAEFKDIVEEVTYGGSRVQVDGGRIRGDGSMGAWGAQFVHKWGVVPRGTVAGVDLSSYSESLCRKYGNPPGPPVPVLDECKLSPVKEITLVKTLDELEKALASGYGVAVCSNQGFSQQRDSRGVCKASGSWAHCMCIDGYHKEDAAKFYHIENSWGPESARGPVGWGDPPTSGFWAEAAVVSRMLSAGDSWAFSGVVGFPKREIDWFVLAPSRQRADTYALWRPHHALLQPWPGLGGDHDVRGPEPIFALGL